MTVLSTDTYHLPPAAEGPGQEDVSNVSFCAGRYRSLWWQKPSPSLWSSPWRTATSELCRNGTFYVLTQKELREFSSHLTTFVLPGHVVQDRSVINKGIQFAVRRSRKKTFVTQPKGGSDGVAEDWKEV